MKLKSKTGRRTNAPNDHVAATRFNAEGAENAEGRREIASPRPFASSAPSALKEEVVAIITGERGQREIVRPLSSAGVACATLDWEQMGGAGFSHLRFIPAVWKLVGAHPGAVIFTDMSSVFLAVIL